MLNTKRIQQNLHGGVGVVTTAVFVDWLEQAPCTKEMSSKAMSLV